MLDRYDQDLLLEYLEDELDTDRRAEIDAMLNDDPQLAGLLVEMAKDREALRSLPQADAPAGLVHDATHAMERQMLLDDTIEDAGPIPLSRGRAHAPDPARSISWGRVVGLTGLAASVAIVAAVLVITFEDPLLRTASDLADNTLGDAEIEPEQRRAESEAFAAGDVAENSAIAERLAAEDESEGTRAASIAAAPPAAEALAKTALDPRDRSALIDRDSRSTTPVPPAAAARSTLNDAAALSQPADTTASLPTAAITAIQPEQQLVLYAESPDVTRQQLVSFCIANGIPVVQPEPTTIAYGHPGLLLKRNNAEQLTQADDINPATDFALLLNESQLDTLVAQLNTYTANAAWQADAAKPTANQVAVLTDLSPLTEEKRAGTAREARLPAADPNASAPFDDRPQVERTQQQQAIQLRSPDLGSVDANRRNVYNLQAQQQAVYSQSATPSPHASHAANLAQADAEAADDVEPQPLSELAAAASESKAASSKDTSDDSANEPVPKPEADKRPVDAPLTKQPVAIDPVRGNWLSAHLPLPDATPLLLSWRDRHVAKPTKLVPVVIRQAEPSQVDALRQQQAEQASREESSESDANANTAAPNDKSDTEDASE